MVYAGYYGNQGQPRRFEQNNNTYNPGVKHPNLSWRSNNVLQPNAPMNPPRQAYIPPFKQQQQPQPNQQPPQPNQQQAWRWNNDDDALGTNLKALNDMKEGSNRVESKLEDLSSRVRRLEAKEEQTQARQGWLPSQPEPAKTV